MLTLNYFLPVSWHKSWQRHCSDQFYQFWF